jgi:hypothetical protein
LGDARHTRNPVSNKDLTIEALLMLVLGWLLGILGGPVAERIRRGYRRRELDEALRGELRECRHLLGSVAYRLKSHLGEVDRELLDWVRVIGADEAALTGDRTTLEHLDQLRALPDAAFAAFQTNRVSQGVRLTLRTYELPLLDMSKGELILLPLTLRRNILSVRRQLDFMNQEVPRLARLHELTFDSSLASVNRQVITRELTDGYRTLARRARQTADQIARLLGV